MFQFAFSMIIAFVGTLVAVHDGPDPAGSWVLGKKNLRNGFLHAERGVEMKVQGAPLPEAVNDVSVLRFNGRTDYLTAESSWPDLVKTLPQKAFTISTWVSVDTTQPNGGIISALQDNGDHEYGWVLGYNESSFSFGLSTEGASDGNGVMTYLSAKTKIESGRWHHVVGIYDGQEMQIWVNGKLEGSSTFSMVLCFIPRTPNLPSVPIVTTTSALLIMAESRPFKSTMSRPLKNGLLKTFQGRQAGPSLRPLATRRWISSSW